MKIIKKLCSYEEFDSIRNIFWMNPDIDEYLLTADYSRELSQARFVFTKGIREAIEFITDFKLEILDLNLKDPEKKMEIWEQYLTKQIKYHQGRLNAQTGLLDLIKKKKGEK